MNDRRTVATQGAEVSADFTTFAFDDRCAEYLADAGATATPPAHPDPDATLRRRACRRPERLGALRRPPRQRQRQRATGVRNRTPRSIDQCFIGSCANGQLEDLRIAAEVLRGRTVAAGVRLIVTPASQAVYRDAVRLGYVQAIADAGAVVTNSTCGACFGYHLGVVGAGEVCMTASTRNFKGRMGSPDRRHLHGLPGDGGGLRTRRPHHRPAGGPERMTPPLSGRAWLFGDGLDHRRDVPGFAMKFPIPKPPNMCSTTCAPAGPRRCDSGDIVVAGKNLVSARVAQWRADAPSWVAALIAEEFNSLFFRNAINNGLPALTIPGVRGVINDGDEITVHLAEGSLPPTGTPACTAYRCHQWCSTFSTPVGCCPG